MRASHIEWWIYGTLLYIIALPHAWVIGTNMEKCPYCAEFVKANPVECRYCDRDFK